MIVHVTQEHIDKGRPRDPRGCAVALAVKAADPTARDVLASPWAVSDWLDWHVQRTARLFGGVTRRILALDAGRPVEPFEFDLTWEAA